MVETLLQAKPEALYQLPWLQRLPGRLAMYHSRHRKLLAAEDSSSSKDDASEENTWASVEQESNPVTQQVRRQSNSIRDPSDDDHSVAGEASSSTVLQQQQRQVNSFKDDESGEDSSNVADTGSSLYTEQQQIRLDLQHVVEEQLAEMQGTAALQARTQRRMGPLVKVDQQQSMEGSRDGLILTLTSECACICCHSLLAGVGGSDECTWLVACTRGWPVHAFLAGIWVCLFTCQHMLTAKVCAPEALCGTRSCTTCFWRCRGNIFAQTQSRTCCCASARSAGSGEGHQSLQHGHNTLQLCISWACNHQATTP